mgnify:CR=1 FL=1
MQSTNGVNDGILGEKTQGTIGRAKLTKDEHRKVQHKLKKQRRRQSKLRRKELRQQLGGFRSEKRIEVG